MSRGRLEPITRRSSRPCSTGSHALQRAGVSAAGQRRVPARPGASARLPRPAVTRTPGRREARDQPDDSVVTHVSWLKVTGGIHVSDAEVRAVFSKNPKHYQPGKRALVPGRRDADPDPTAGEGSRRSDAPLCHGRGEALAGHLRPGYAPVSEMALARKIWAPGAHKKCDLPGGSYSWQKAREHGCVEAAGLPGVGWPACTLIDLPLGPSGFTSGEMNDGFAEYLMDNAGLMRPRSAPGACPG